MSDTSSCRPGIKMKTSWSVEIRAVEDVQMLAVIRVTHYGYASTATPSAFVVRVLRLAWGHTLVTHRVSPRVFRLD